MKRCLLVLLVALSLLVVDVKQTAAQSWQAGAAKVDITPRHFMPMSGYAGRGAKHANGKLTDLWAKALVLEDDDGQRGVLVTYDLIGMDYGLSKEICNALSKKYGLKREQIALNFSHTHTGPVVAKNLRPMHYMMLDEANRKLVDEYAEFVRHKSVAVVGDAIEGLGPAKVTWGSGTATFAANRRNNPEGEITQRRESGKVVGPYDHDVPVLAINDEDEKLLAVVFGYACHNTTLSSFQWSGDYAGFAQMEVEKSHPDCVAMFWAGCGGDQNPLPRRKVEHAKEYGRRLGEAVAHVLNQKEELHAVAARLITSYREIDLPYAKLPTRDELLRESKSTNKYIAARADFHLQQWAGGNVLSPTYPYPVQTWQIGEDVQFLFLGGEVVVDYAVRLKEEMGGEKLERKNIWVASYSNDVMAYIPSRRVLTEGGYEGGGAMIYYGLPANWAPEVEELIVKEVKRQSK